MKRVLAALLGAGLLLAGCGQNTPAATSPSGAYADGLDHSWTASTAEGQQLYGALTQGLKAQDFSIGLSITATNGYGPIELNTSNGEYAGGDGHPITLNGQVYPTGLGVHANSEIHIHATNLQTPACTRFQADVGVDDEVGNNGSVVFQVFADGVKLFDSGVMTGASATQHIDVGIGNKSDLRFVVTDAGDGSFYDHADWAGATLTCSPAVPSPSPSGSRDSSFGVNGQIGLTGNAKFVQVVQLPDNNLLALTEDHTSSGTPMIPAQLKRFFLNGQPDQAYGQGGSTTLQTDLVGRKVIFGADNKLYLSGVQAPAYRTFISRHSLDGNFDNTFANNGVLVGNANTSNDLDFVIQPDGKIVVAVTEFEEPNNLDSVHVNIRRFTALGNPDDTFGQSGIVSVPGIYNADDFLIQQPDEKILLSFSTGFTTRIGKLSRYSKDGKIDITFGQGGTINTGFPYNEITNTSKYVNVIKAQLDGKLLTAGVIINSDNTLSQIVSRYTDSGQPDVSFGNAGTTIISGLANDIYDGRFSDLAIQKDGRILAALKKRAVLRFTPDGKLDTAYGKAGLVDLGIEDGTIRNLTLQSDGKVLVNISRYSFPEAGYLVRLLP